MSLPLLADLQSTLDQWDDIARQRSQFVTDNEDIDDGEPLCGHPKWDETLADYDTQLTAVGHTLADALRKALG